MFPRVPCQGNHEYGVLFCDLRVLTPLFEEWYGPVGLQPSMDVSVLSVKQQE